MTRDEFASMLQRCPLLTAKDLQKIKKAASILCKRLLWTKEMEMTYLEISCLMSQIEKRSNPDNDEFDDDGDIS